MAKLSIGIYSFANVMLGVLYSMSNGPYADINGKFTSTRELVSSGGDDWFLVTVALTIFLVSAALSFLPKIQVITALISYIACYLLYVICLLMVQLDTNVIESIKHGDTPLLLSIIAPATFLVLGINGVAKSQQR